VPILLCPLVKLDTLAWATPSWRPGLLIAADGCMQHPAEGPDLHLLTDVVDDKHLAAGPVLLTEHLLHSFTASGAADDCSPPSILILLT
jgi:hypothetical protein